MKKKILYMINSLKNGGPVNMLYMMVKYIDTDKFDVTLLALNPSPDTNSREFPVSKCNVIVLKEEGIAQTIKAAQKVVDILIPDIIHSHGGMADVVNSKIKGKHVTFSTVHCDPYEDFCMKKGKILGTLKASVFIHTMMKINNPIACSETVSRKIKRRKGISIDFVRNGIDLDMCKNSKQCIERKDLGIGEDSIVLFFCGYLSKRKNVSFIFETLERTKRNDIELVVLGNGDEFESLKLRSEGDSRIHMLGRVLNSFEYMNIGDYFVSASLSEGLPLAVMEGMACGMPAILSDIESHRELEKCCSDAVKIFSLENNNELSNILEQLKVLPINEIKARKVIYEYLNAKRMADEYAEKYINSL